MSQINMLYIMQNGRWGKARFFNHSYCMVNHFNLLFISSSKLISIFAESCINMIFLCYIRHYYPQSTTIQKAFGGFKPNPMFLTSSKGSGMGIQLEVKTAISSLTVWKLDEKKSPQQQDKWFCLFHMIKTLYVINA